MKVFIHYAEPEVAILKHTVRSWQAHGFEVRLVLPDSPEPKSGLVVSGRHFNRGYPSRSPKSAFRRSVKKFGSPGWETAKIVEFPEGQTTEELILSHASRLPN